MRIKALQRIMIAISKKNKRRRLKPIYFQNVAKGNVHHFRNSILFGDRNREKIAKLV